MTSGAVRLYEKIIGVEIPPKEKKKKSNKCGASLSRMTHLILVFQKMLTNVGDLPKKMTTSHKSISNPTILQLKTKENTW